MNIIGSIDGLEMGSIVPNSIVNADCLGAMRLIPDKSIDAIICDLPYGITACKWDTVIPFDLLWEQYKRIIKPNGAIALFGSQPFTSALVMSNPKWFKYEWIWEKSHSRGFLNAWRQPMRKHESICVFSKKQSIYNPILSKKKLENIRPISGRTPSAQYGHFLSNSKEARKCPKDRSMPSSILFFNSESGNTPHPTQKPVALIEYLLKTYTIEGELVLDNTAGSGTLAIAAINTNRRYICIEKDPDYFEVMRNRIENHDPNAPIKTKKTKSVAKD